MASVSVFVDCAVRGELPRICARTGAFTDSVMQIDKPIGGLGAAAWLLLFLGPMGWIILVLLHLLGAGREMLSVRVPYSPEALERERPLRRLRWGASLASVVLLVMAIIQLFGTPKIWLTLAALSSALALATHIVLYLSGIDVKLDASRRWVILSNVHAEFASAVKQRSGGERLV